MSVGSFDDGKTVTVASDGTASVSFNGPPPNQAWIVTVYTACKSASGLAQVFDAGRFRGSLPGVAQAWGGQLRVDPPGPIDIRFANMIPTDQVAVSISGVAYSDSDIASAPFPTFTSQTSVDLAAQAQYQDGTVTAGNQEQAIVVPGANQRVRIVTAFVDVPSDVARGAGAQDVAVQLRDLTLGSNATLLRRFYAPAAIPGGAVGSDPGPWADLGSGILFPVGSTVGIRLSFVLTTGDVSAVLGFVIEG